MDTLSSSQRFINACWQKPVDKTPVWFMRQAGRYLSEYRAIRANHTLLEICAQPELAAQVTLQPVNRLGVDAAILFADILLPLIPMGIQLDFAAGEGPVIHNPIQNGTDVDALRPVEPRESLAHVLAAIQIVRKELDGKTALIGFAGAPFTLASYIIEGGPSKNYLKTKRLMVEQPDTWDRLMSALAELVSNYLVAQIEAGAQAVQLFDSWAGTALGPHDYREHVLLYSKHIFDRIHPTGVPAIHFSVGANTYLPLLKEAGGDVIGLDWRTPIDWGRAQLGDGVAVQGNLDPTALFYPRQELEKRICAVLEQAGGRPGHIFNLGHGVLPETPVEHVRAAVELVHEHSQRRS